MSILNNLKKALGFSGTATDDDLEESFNYTDDSAQRPPYINPFKKEETSAPSSVIETSVPKVPTPVPTSTPTASPKMMPQAEKYELPDDFLNSIIEIVNANLPQIVKECVDIDAERKALSQTFGAHFQDALNGVHIAALSEAKSQWETERQAMTEKMTSLTASAEESSKRTEEIRQKLKVEESKRRTIAERATDLEARIATLEAEHEQFTIENKSLVNKMKVMQVYADDAKVYKEQVDERDNIINKLNEKIATAVIADEKAKTEIEKAKAETATANEEIIRLKEEIAEAQKNLEVVHELQTQLEQVDAFKAKKNKEIAALKSKIEEMQKEYESATADTKTANCRIDELNANIDRLTLEHEASIKRIDAERDNTIKRIATERDEAKSLLEKEEKAHREDVAWFEQKIKFIEAEQKRNQAEMAELNAEIKRLKELEQTPSITLAQTIDIEPEIREAVAETFGIGLNDDNTDITSTVTDEPKIIEADFTPTPAAPIVAEPIEPEAPSEPIDNDIFSDDNIDATFDIPAAEPIIEEKPKHKTSKKRKKEDNEAATAATEPAAEPKVSAIDELDDIDWLMPTPPTPPTEPAPVAEEEEEPAKPAAKSQHDQDNTQQMSLF